MYVVKQRLNSKYMLPLSLKKEQLRKQQQKKLQQIQTFLLSRTAKMAIRFILTIQVRDECSAHESWLCVCDSDVFLQLRVVF